MSSKSKVAIIGQGNVGSALAKGLGRAGYEVRTVGKDPDAVAEIARWSDVVVLAVPFPEVDNVVEELGEMANGKALVDATNALTPESDLALGFDTSGAEELQEKLPRAEVVKAFNTVFAQHMEQGRVKGERLTLLAASDHRDAKKRVLEMGRDIGFDAVDAGPLSNARLLEPLGCLNIQLGQNSKMGTDVGFRFVH